LGKSESPRKRVPELTAALDEVVMIALDPDPTRRYATAEEMAIALEEACSPATRDEVGRFVERIGFASIERLDELMRACQTHPREETVTATPLATEAASPHVSRRALAVVLVGLIAIAAGLLLSQVSRPRRDPAIPAAHAETPTPRAEIPAPPPSPPASIEPPPLATIAEPSSSPAATERAPSRAAPNALPPAPPKPRVVDKPKPSCTPPFEYDANGRKHYKRECLP
jgi:hypothetical protein